MKVFLHISNAEQAERLQARLDDPTKKWSFNAGHLDERGHWDTYQKAYEEVLTPTSTAHAPWYVVPADRKWFRNYAVATILTEAIAALKPKYPLPERGLDKILIS